MFRNLCNKKGITEKELKYFSYNLKNTRCLVKMRLRGVPRRPAISDRGISTEESSEILDYHLCCEMR